MRSLLVVLVGSALLSLIDATPTISFPFEQQLPPVAFYGVPYQYTLNRASFQSPTKIYYSIPDLPSWLKFDAATLKFSGTPNASDGPEKEQEVSFTILASDETGTTPQVCKLQVSTAQPPKQNKDLPSALSQAGSTLSGDSLVLTPGKEFKFSFPADFFESSQEIVSYSGVSADHSPLPAWVFFDGGSRTFWGRAPDTGAWITSPDTYQFVYIASTYQGFSSALVEFQMLNGLHVLETTLHSETLNVEEGDHIEYVIPLSEITLNGVPLEKGQVSNVTLETPDNQDWLEYDRDNNAIKGKVPRSLRGKQISVPVNLTDIYSDSIGFELAVNVSSVEKSNDKDDDKDDDNETETTAIFRSSKMSPLNVTSGKFFTYSLESFVRDKNASVELDSNKDNDWVSYVPSNYSLMGMPPKHFKSSELSIVGTLPNGQVQRSTIPLVAAGTPSVDPTPSSSSSPSPSHSSKPKKSNNKALAIGLGVGIPLFVLAVLAVILFCLCRRRRRNKEASNGTPGNPHYKPQQVSAPMSVSAGQMAPVFKTVSESGSEDTIVGTPEFKDKPQDWTSPQWASALNYMRLESDTNSEAGSALPPQAPVPSPEVLGVAAVPAVGTGATALAAKDSAPYNNVPRESVRHTNINDRRWQDNRTSMNSVSSVVANVPPTVQLASDEFESRPRKGAATGARIPRDESSGIMHSFWSDASSAISEEDVDPPTMPLHGEDVSQHKSSSSESFYDVKSGSENSGLNIRPLRGDDGDVRWEGQEESNSSRTRLTANPSLRRTKQSKDTGLHESQAARLAFI